MRRARLVWFSAAALGFVSVAIPLQLEREWITIGWALEALAVTLLWRRLDHPGLKYFALALIASVTVRLVGNEAVLGYYPRPAWRIVNWLLYTYGLPAAAFVAASSILAASELPRLRAWERITIYQRRIRGWRPRPGSRPSSSSSSGSTLRSRTGSPTVRRCG